MDHYRAIRTGKVEPQLRKKAVLLLRNRASKKDARDEDQQVCPGDKLMQNQNFRATSRFSRFFWVLFVAALGWISGFTSCGDDHKTTFAAEAGPANTVQNPASSQPASDASTAAAAFDAGASSASLDAGAANSGSRGLDAQTGASADTGTGAVDASAHTPDTSAPGVDASAPSTRADAEIETHGVVYVTMAGAAEVVAFEETSLKVIKRYTTGDGPAIIVATPDRGKLFTANWMAESISVINTRTDKVSTIELTGRPYVIAIDREGKRLYAGVNPTGIAVINVETNAIEKTLETSDLASSITVSADGKMLYVANTPISEAGTLRAISSDTGEIVKEAIAVGATPAWITSKPDGSRVYTLNFYSDNVTVVDTEGWGVLAYVPTGTESKGIIGNVTPDGKALYLTNFGTGELMRIDTDSSQVVQTIKMKGRPIGVNFSPDSKRVYVTDFGPGTLDQPTTDFLSYLLQGNYQGPEQGRLTAFDVATGAQIGDEVLVDKGPTSVVVGTIPVTR
jgi:YVTN family beta-propeller protein